MKPPCDEAAIESGSHTAPCEKAVERWILAATILGSSMVFVDSTVVNVALPAIQNSLGGTVTNMQWVVETYGLLLSALILTGGALGDLFGRKRVFLFGVTVFAVASMACALALNIRELVIARAVQGFGAAFLVPGSLSIISASFPESRRGRAIGTWSGLTSITAAAGPVVGGWLIENASWRWAFFMNLPLALAVLVLSFWRVPESKAEAKSPVDWIGALLVTAGLTGVTYGFIESSSRGWTKTSVVSGFVLGGACLICFAYFEAHTTFPMLPFGLFRSPEFSGANLLTLFLYSAMGIFFFLFPLDLIQVQHYSATAAGAAALPFILLMFLLSRWSGGLIARFGPRRPLIAGPIVAALGFLCFVFPSVGGSYWTTFFPGFMVLGLGMAMSVAPLTTVVMGAVDQNLAGTSSGINNAVARVAGLLAIAVLGMVMVDLFSEHLNRSIAALGLPTDLARVVRSNEPRLAALSVPRGLDTMTAAKLGSSIDHAFVFGFRVIMLICAGLSVASSAFAWCMIGTDTNPPKSLKVGC
jgi:EmrB/QacA subfamily drug resistance transporter